jgi:hypothetical protein
MTPGWTDAHSRVVIAVLVALIGTGGGLLEGRDVTILVIGAIAATFVISFAADAWIGLIVGLAAAAGLTFLRQVTGTWLPSHFGPAVVESVALLGTGWAAGRAGYRMRPSRSTDQLLNATPGVYGSLGLLPADLALVRLEEEVARALAHGRPLSLIVTLIRIVDADLDGPARDEAERGVARLIESLLRDLDVPFALTADEIGAILPETDAVAAAVASGRIVEAIAAATFADRRTGLRRRLADAADVHIAVVSLGGEFPDARKLLDGAVSRLPDQRGHNS